MSPPGIAGDDAMHMGLKAPAGRTSDQGATAWGGRQRNGPTGGAANGMPLKTETPDSVTPWTRPSRVMTDLPVGAHATESNARSVAVAIDLNVARFKLESLKINTCRQSAKPPKPTATNNWQ